MIVPVWLSHTDSPEVETLLYAILDNQSDTSFILKQTANRLKLPSADVTLSLSTMLAADQLINSSKITGLSVRGFSSQQKIPIPSTFTRDIMPAHRDHIPTPDTARKWSHLQVIASDIAPLQECDIALLIGFNVPKALEPVNVIPSNTSRGPFAQKTVLGWGIVGTIDKIDKVDSFGVSHHELSNGLFQQDAHCKQQPHIVLRSTVKEVFPEDVLRILQSDFNESTSHTHEKISQEDRQFMSILEKGIHMVDGHYQMPLPFKTNHPIMSNNRTIALQRLRHLKRRLQREDTFRKHYNTFMCELFSRGYAEKIETAAESSSCFYIPHHGVYNINKPGKVRVVFDCSAKETGKASLNDCLLQGPDLTNSLMGVLCRFRLEPVAFLCDIEKMFYQFRVDERHRDFLRFFWWPSGNLDSEPQEFRMTVHLFGASSSPGCSNFGLKQTARDNASQFGQHVADFLHDNFYVDDGLKSCASSDEAIDLVQKSVMMCAQGGLRLHKFVTNNESVMRSIPEADRADNSTPHSLLSSNDIIERALGIQWCVKSDTFRYKVVLKERPPTRRGILSTVSSIYDPLGFLSPFILLGKQILQSLCQDGYDWDTEVPIDVQEKWKSWKSDVRYLDGVEIDRCVKPKDFGKVVHYELHHFADASSSTGYGTCSYLRQINQNNQVHVSLVMGKSRVIPLKKITVPRLELTAAVVAVNISRFLETELKLTNLKSYYWTDSTVTLGYIANSSRRFHVFVANRIEQIRSHTNPSQWRHVSGESNPADIASRGMSAKRLVESELWFKGPSFLWETNLPQSQLHIEVDPDDEEIKRTVVLTIQTQNASFDLSRFNHISDWFRLKRAVALCLKLKDHLKGKLNVRKTRNSSKRKRCIVDSITATDLADAQNEIIRMVQRDSFGNLKVGESVSKQSSLSKLDVYLDEKHIIRVGGRLRQSTQPQEIQHPIVLPKRGHVTQLILRDVHQRCFHQGKGITLNKLRESGFWIINAASLVGHMILKCVVCRKVRNTTQIQKWPIFQMIGANKPLHFPSQQLISLVLSWSKKEERC